MVTSWEQGLANARQSPESLGHPKLSVKRNAPSSQCLHSPTGKWGKPHHKFIAKSDLSGSCLQPEWYISQALNKWSPHHRFCLPDRSPTVGFLLSCRLPPPLFTLFSSLSPPLLPIWQTSYRPRHCDTPNGHTNQGCLLRESWEHAVPSEGPRRPCSPKNHILPETRQNFIYQCPTGAPRGQG